MKTTIQRGATILALLLALCAFASAQTTPPPSAMIVPSQLASAKTVFLGFAGGYVQFASNAEILSDFASAVQQQNRYTFVSSPGEAELCMRLQLNGGAIQINIYDTKTDALLWTIATEIQLAGLTKNVLKKRADAAKDLTAQLDQLASGKVPSWPQNILAR